MKVEIKGERHIEVKCPHGNEFTRTSPIGMFCSEPECRCEIESKKALSEMFDPFFKENGMELPPEVKDEMDG